MITITAPTASQYLANSTPAIAWKITDDDSGVNPTTIGVTIDSGSKITGDSITKKAVSGGYECTYTPDTALSDGSIRSRLMHLIMTAMQQSRNPLHSRSIQYRRHCPLLHRLMILLQSAACTVKGITNDVTSSPVTVTINLTAAVQRTVTVRIDGSFSKALTLAAGSNTITIVARDSAGKTTTITRTVKLDTTPPTIKSITLTPNPVDAGKTFVISVEVTD